VDDTKKKKNATNEPVEVFLGGSCNPTTWRADVAIPALKELGISFYNPVSISRKISISWEAKLIL